MNEDLKDTLNAWGYKSLPLFASIIMLLFSYLPLKSELANNARPAVGLMCAYFWLVYRPDLFNILSVFMLGLMSDLISVSPMGSNIIAYLLMYVMVMHLIKYLNGKPFIVIWSGLALLLLVALLCRWLVLSLYYHQFLPIGILSFTYFVSLALYPIVGGINALILNHYMKDDF